MSRVELEEEERQYLVGMRWAMCCRFRGWFLIESRCVLIVPWADYFCLLHSFIVPWADYFCLLHSFIVRDR